MALTLTEYLPYIPKCSLYSILSKQKLALPSTTWIWGPDTGKEGEIARKWSVLENLREIVVVVEEEWERLFVGHIPQGMAEYWRLEIPKDIESSLRKLQGEVAGQERDLPRVRVVREERGY